MHLMIQLIMCHVLVSATGISACKDWDVKGDKVCCNDCKPGNHLVMRCGTDVSELCTPCETNTYSHSSKAFYCQRCTECIDPQVEKKPCDGIEDTVCGCKPGYRCGNVPQCDYCVEECAVGQEPTDEGTCRKCPEGTFNNKNHSECKPWSKSCPKGEHISERGSEVSDIKCTGIPESTILTSEEIPTLESTDRERAKDDFSLYTLIGCFSVCVICILLLLLFLAIKRSKSESEEPKPDIQTPDLTIMMVDHEDCSYHQPEQEQGGSSDSIDTQGSETKLIV